MPATAPVTRRRLSARRPDWVRLPDEELLRLRMCDLRLDLHHSPLRRHIERLYDELDGRGIRFRPHVWLSDDWFSPDGVPGIAVPFYLAHPRLMRLARKMTREVEGSNANWLMRILRHEAGHAIDSAYRLRRRAHWRALFGPASRPYRDRYRARPASRHHVQHLGDWYAQSHPTEDFAETFAVWLAPRSGWQRRYAAWPALRKLHFVQQLACELGAHRPPVRCRTRIEPLHVDQRTLGQYFRSKADLARTHRSALADRLLRQAFATDIAGARGIGTRSVPVRGIPVRGVPAHGVSARSVSARSVSARGVAALLRAHKPRLLAWMIRTSGVDRYVAHQVMRAAIGRSAALGLQFAGTRREALAVSRGLLRRLARRYLRSQGLRLAA